jgi:uncharacterized protein (DUF58 family)
MPLPTSRLIAFVAAAAPAFLAAALYPSAAVLGVGYLLILALAACVEALLLRRRTRCSVERLLPERFTANRPLPVRYLLRNESARVLRVTLAERLPRGASLDAEQLAAELPPGVEVELTANLTCPHRGVYALDKLDLRVEPQRALFARQQTLALRAEVHVYPSTANIRAYELRLRRNASSDAGLRRSPQAGTGSEFDSLRRYVPGDDVTHLDWKASAKRRELIVRHLVPERRQNVLVAIDTGRATAGTFAGTSRLDSFVDATLLLAYAALRAGDYFSLVAFSDRIDSYLPPIRGVKRLDEVARALYRLESKLVEADYASACQFLNQRNRKRSLIVMMTDVVDRDASADVLGYLARYRQHHLPLLVSLLDPDLRAVAEGPGETTDPFVRAAALDVVAARGEALHAMRRQGVGVLDVPPGTLTPALLERYLRIKAARSL